jgi:hypothetical protein
MLAAVTLQAEQAPRIWDGRALADWATPIAALGVRPGHYSEAEYYNAPVDNYQTYPVYHPAHEPKGYQQWLRQQKPKPLLDARSIHNTQDWIREGRRVFIQMDDALFRTDDPAVIAAARDPANFKGVHLTREGYVLDRLWVVTPQGLMISSTACLGCHVRVERNGDFTPAGPGTPYPKGITDIGPRKSFPVHLLFERLFPGDTIGQANWRTFHVPWEPDARVEAIRNMRLSEAMGLISANGNTTVFARFNGSPFAMTKVPDLQNLRYSRYIDATGTHKLRGPEDIARYGALVVSADVMEFGAHKLLEPEQRRVLFRYADELLYAIGMYLWSLEPPRNPKLAAAAQRHQGEAIFRREGCPVCHTPPTYTSGKLTLAQGWRAPADHAERENVMPLTLGTDEELALRTRKGTGFYKIPSLRGLWYRPSLLHDGSIASLEELFDPARLTEDHVAGGWKPPGVEKRAIRGHQFGLRLEPKEKEALLAFLRGL